MTKNIKKLNDVVYIIVVIVFNDGKKQYPQVFLDDCLAG